MEDVAFQSALSFALHGLGCPNLSLKAEQREAVWQVYSGKDVFAGCQQDMGSRSAMRSYHGCWK